MYARDNHSLEAGGTCRQLNMVYTKVEKYQKNFKLYSCTKMYQLKNFNDPYTFSKTFKALIFPPSNSRTDKSFKDPWEPWIWLVHFQSCIFSAALSVAASLSCNCTQISHSHSCCKVIINIQVSCSCERGTHNRKEEKSLKIGLQQ